MGLDSFNDGWDGKVESHLLSWIAGVVVVDRGRMGLDLDFVCGRGRIG